MLTVVDTMRDADLTAFDGTGRTEIEDPAFRAELADTRVAPGRRKEVRGAAQIALVLIPLPGLFIIQRK
jgi:hypothetical protein